MPNFPGPMKYLQAMGENAELAIVPYSLAARALDVKVSTVQSYVRKGILREVTIGKNRRWVGVLASDVFTESTRRQEEIRSRVPGASKLLKRAARKRTLIEYNSGLMEPLDLDHTHAHDRELLGKILGDVSKRSYKHRGRMLSVLAVRKNSGLPNEVFFDLARHLGALKDGEDEEAFFRREKKAVFNEYGRGPQSKQSGSRVE